VGTFLKPKWLSGAFCYEENSEKLWVLNVLEVIARRIEVLISLLACLREIMGIFVDYKL
jgi:hypothetical protein